MCPRGPLARRTRRTAPHCPAESPDAAPLSGSQIAALSRGIWRELTWALPLVAREVRAWRARALKIPPGPLRENALSALATKRAHADGAALFSSIAHRRDRRLLRLLVTYELIWDFLDTVNECGASAGQRNGAQLHLALIDALDPTRPLSEHYLHHPWKDDGGYLAALTEACRNLVTNLPHFHTVRPLLLEEATRAQVLAINHELSPDRRDTDLRVWASRQTPVTAARWFETSGAASASLAVHALLAAANNATCSKQGLLSVRDAYFPWISAATTMLDSFVDQAEDQASGDHSYIRHYPSAHVARTGVELLITRSLSEARQLADGDRHVLIVSSMAAMYLSKDSAHTPQLREDTEALAAAGGSLTSLLLPVLRAWRTIYRQRPF